jgi:photosystem II stability/assembly factor-like uncharacterized protein
VSADTPAAFFSYCRDDSEFALRLAEDLKTGGANVWIDQLDIEPGTLWDRAILGALTSCPHMLVILSPDSVESENVLDEVAFALEQHKRVIPVLYRDCKVPFRIARLQRIDFRTDYGHGLKTLLRVLAVSQAASPRETAAPAFDKTAVPDLTDEGGHHQGGGTAPHTAERTTKPRSRTRAGRTGGPQVAQEEGAKPEPMITQKTSRPLEADTQPLSSQQPRGPSDEGTETVGASSSHRSSDVSSRKIGVAVIALFAIAMLAVVVYRLAAPPTVALGWAVGSGGTILHTENGGLTWERQSTDFEELLTSVTFATPRLGWAVGSFGTILHTEDGGHRWQKQSIGGGLTLNAVRFITPQLGWAVGEGLILHTKNGGLRWDQQSVNGVDFRLRDVTFSTPQLGWAVGDGGVIFHTDDGQRWQQQISGTNANLRSGSFVSSQSGWTVGDGGTILHTGDGGFTWAKQDSGVSGENDNLRRVTFVTQQSGLVAGDFGLLHTEDGGRTWQRIIGAPDDLDATYFISPKVAWAVRNLAILHTEDGGRTWKTQKQANARLYSVAFVKPK